MTQWWMQDEVDEVMPTGMKGPDDFIMQEHGASNFWWIGRAEEFKDDPDARKKLIHIGDTVEFYTQEFLGHVEILFRKDGTYEAKGDIPENYNGIWSLDDWIEFTGDSLEEIGQQIKDDGIDIEEDERLIMCSFCRHNTTSLIYRLERGGEKGATFKQVIGYVMADGTTEYLDKGGRS